MNGDLSTFDRASNALVQAATSGGFTINNLPRGQDVSGFGFPSYDGGPNTPETQTYGEGDDRTDYERGIAEIMKDPIGGVGKVLGEIFNNPGKALADGMGTVAADGAKQIGGALAPWMLRAGFAIVGVLLLAFGLWAAMKSAPSEQPA